MSLYHAVTIGLGTVVKTPTEGGTAGQVLTLGEDTTQAEWADLPAGAESPLVLTASAATETPLTVQGAASQSAALIVGKNAADAQLFAVGSTGTCTIGAPLSALPNNVGCLFKHNCRVHGDHVNNVDTKAVFDVVDLNGNQLFAVRGAGRIDVSNIAIAANPSLKDRQLVVSGARSNANLDIGRVTYRNTEGGPADIAELLCQTGQSADDGQLKIRVAHAGSYVELLCLHHANGVILPTLPTSDPLVTGAVWNDGGTLKISAGA